ncbi:MAG: NAD(P)/FAD-dependent oxidoreductase [Patescibacteria group bacterium]
MIYDVVIIGGGPAGIMSAIQASELGVRVVLLEKNNDLGVKLLITGHGRCNITNMMADSKEKINVYGKNFKFLFSVLNKFSVSDTITFFKNIGIDTRVEDNYRVFPLSNKASDVQLALKKYLEKNNVEIMFNTEVKEIIAVGNKIEKVILKSNKEIFSKNFIICTGGKSYEATGSTGDGYKWLKKIGHTIIKPRPALAPIIVEEKIVKKLEGLSLKNIEITVFQNSKKIISSTGEIIFTANGLSGPAIIDLSSRIGSLLLAPVILQIDFFPELESIELEKKLQNDFHHSRNKIFKNYLTSLVSPKLAPIIIELTNINGLKQVSAITKEERQLLVCCFKKFILKVKELKGFDKAMITAGGVDVKEVDPKTMRSKLFQNLFLAGEILDLDGPTGGYNLQICWSTGFVAGESIFKNLHSKNI